MKRRLICAIVAVMFFVLPQAYAQVDTLTILHLNDTHSHLLPYGPKDSDGDWTLGGYARIATLVGMSRITDPNVMLLHGGDLFVGDFMFQEYVGVAELEIMKALNFDALELGNHEFDLYPTTLEYVLSTAGFPSEGFPVLCANLDYSGDPVIGNFVSPYTIKEIGGQRVGILGLMTDLTNQISNPSPVVVLPPLTVAQAWVDSLRIGHDCDIVILLSHMGADYDQMAAATISGIDLIVGGHSHTFIPDPIQIGNTLILQAGEFGRYLGKLHLYIEGGAIEGWNYDFISVDSSVPEEPTLAAMINGLAAGVEADSRFGPVYTDVIANAATELTKPLSPGAIKDTPIGNLVADALRAQTGTDIAFQPQGFISQTIYAGPVKASDIFQALPYGFDPESGLGLKLVTFQTDGMSIIAGLEFTISFLPYVEDFLLQTSNLSYVYNLANPPGSRIDYASVLINGQPLNPYGSYTVTAPDAVVPFFSQIPGFNISNLVLTDYFVYTVGKDFIVAHSPVSYYSDGRIIDVSLFDDPMTGVGALSDVLDIFGSNGSISSTKAMKVLDHHLDIVALHLQNNETMAAINGLNVFMKDVARLSSQGFITSWSSARLTFLALQLQASIGQETPKAANDILPSRPGISQNYPNPFNAQSVISYSLPQSCHVMIQVYDILGRQVAALVDEDQAAGDHQVTWDASDDVSGVYFYRIQAGSYIETKKMLLMK